MQFIISCFHFIILFSNQFFHKNLIILLSTTLSAFTAFQMSHATQNSNYTRGAHLQYQVIQHCEYIESFLYFTLKQAKIQNLPKYS